MVHLRRLLLGSAIALALLWSGASSVGALSLHPTNWRSTIVSIAPATDAVSIAVLNGGEAIRLTAANGHTVEIPGYRSEPYLRITADGAVEANLNSPTWWANRTGTGTGDIPASADPAAEPEWSRIATDGTVVWHDHRIHAMPGVTGTTEWTVLVSVDDQPLVIRGQLTELPSHSPILEFLLALAVVVAIVLLGFRWEWPTALSATLIGSVLALVISIGAWTQTPSGFTAPWFTLIASGLSVAFGLIALALHDRSPRVRLVPLLASTATLAWWIALNLPALTAASVPNVFAEVVVRTVLALGAGVVVGVGLIIVITGGFSDVDVDPQAEDASMGTTTI